MICFKLNEIELKCNGGGIDECTGKLYKWKKISSN